MKGFLLPASFAVSCDVSYPEVSWAIDDARVAGVTFSLYSCHDKSTVFRENYLF